MRFFNGAKNFSSALSSTGMCIEFDAATRRLDEGIADFNGATEIAWGETWPAAKCAEAEMITERNLLRNFRRDSLNLPNVSLDGSLF